jgi:hypothetical protein
MPDLRAAAEARPSQLLHVEVLRRPVESALGAAITMEDRVRSHEAGVEGHL